MKSGWKYSAVVSLLLTLSNGTAQPTTYSFEAVDSLQQSEPRPVVVFIHTDWCRFCAAMTANTFTNEAVVDKLNNFFYFIEFHSETKSAIIFNGRTFHYQPTGSTTGIHELAEALGSMNGKIVYPSLCILNTDFEIIFQRNSFMNEKELLKVLEMVEEGFHNVKH